jgi:NAD(P)-dependent dehydrogenase (short-subunit alcohol dehydrogenase family)
MRIVITGTNRGLGLEFARQYLERGDEVVATCRNPQSAAELGELQSQIAERLTILELEVADQQSRENALRGVRQKFGAIDLLINNAAISSGGEKRRYSLGALYEENMARVFQVNAVAPLLVAEAFLELLEVGQDPKVINITSRLGSIGSKSRAFSYSYCASKSALNMFSKMLSIDLQSKGIVVIPIHPGHVQTDMGGSSAAMKPDESIRGMIRVIDSLTLKDSGRYLDWQGLEIPW